MKKLYPSSSAFMWGDVVFTDYDSGCLRSILIKSHLKTPDIDPLYTELGALHEDNYEAEHLKDVPHEKEKPFKVEVLDGVVLSGRIDFLTPDKVHECKSTVSKSTAISWANGKFKTGHLAQTVAYMVQEGIPQGRIICGFYVQDKEGKAKRIVETFFEVSLSEDGVILVNGKPTGFTVSDQLRHRYRAARVLQTQEFVSDRPAGWNQTWGSPCGFCAFRPTCDKYDNNQLTTLSQIIESAQNDLNHYQARPAKLTKE